MKNVVFVLSEEIDTGVFEDFNRRRGLFGGKPSIFEKRGLNRKDYDISLFQYSPYHTNLDSKEIKGINLQNPKQILDSACASDPDCLVIEPYEMGFGDETIYPSFLDLLVQERQRRGIVVWTKALYWEKGKKYSAPCSARGISLVRTRDVEELVSEIKKECDRGENFRLFSLCAGLGKECAE